MDFQSVDFFGWEAERSFNAKPRLQADVIPLVQLSLTLQQYLRSELASPEVVSGNLPPSKTKAGCHSCKWMVYSNASFRLAPRGTFAFLTQRVMTGCPFVGHLMPTAKPFTRRIIHSRREEIIDPALEAREKAT